MSAKEIQDNLTRLVENLNQQEFIYDFLLAYGISKTSITRLKKGDFNLSKVGGEVLYKGKVFFKTEKADKLLISAENAAKEERILKQSPRFVMLTDFEKIVAIDLKKKRPNLDIKLTDLPKHYIFFQPLAGGEAYKSSKDNKADRDAAYKLGELYDALVTANPDYIKESHNLNVFLARLLFCFFAEDTGIFDEESIFTDTLANHTTEDGSDVHTFLNTLFQRLSSEIEEFPEHLQNKFRYVNGGLFNQAIAPPHFTAKSRKILLECGDLDWSEINPDIFGSMIQAVADPEERSDLGMHYTSVTNIKKLIEPLFLDELKEEFQKNLTNTGNLKKLLKRMGEIKFFDPACGSGNFLIITYKELRLLEIEIIQRLIDIEKEGGQLSIYFTSINLSQFYGIEIKDFAHEIAILSLWLAEYQMNKIFDLNLEGRGQSKPILPLKEAAKIVCANAARKNWEEVCSKEKNDEIYVLGNPPYDGARKQKKNQKEDIVYVLNSIHGHKNMDYVSIWFYKGKKYIKDYNAKCAFVTTNSVCQGEQVSLLWPQILNDDIEIDFAYQSFKWKNNAKANAGVTVIIVSLRNLSNNEKFLFSESIKKVAKNINAYLLDSKNIYVLPRTRPISKLPQINFGSMPNDGGHLLLNENEKNEILAENIAAKEFIKKFRGSTEFINEIPKYCLWIEETILDKALAVRGISDRIDSVKTVRKNSDRVATQKLASIPFRFGESRHKNSESIIIPIHSSEEREYIPIGFLNSETIISNAAMAIYDAQPWIFGIIHSKIHMVWVDTIGGKIKEDYRYSAKLCYNTFPFPQINEKQKETISQYVFQVLDERAKYPEKTMAWMYNPETMPKGLKQAHKELDEAVERIYRLSPFQNDAERLDFLFKLYEDMISKNTLFAKPKKVRTQKVKESE